MTTQAKAGYVKMDSSAFEKCDDTRVYWVCNGGVLINSRGTCILIDPLLEGFDMPLLSECPLAIDDVTHVDGVLVTHCDNDHFSKITNKKIMDRCDSYHAPHYVASLFEEEGISATGHDINESFMINDVKVTLTPADHAWQNDKPKYAALREYKMEDYCGFWLDTPDGSIWMPGDSRLLPQQLTYQNPDVILLDISDSKWHIGHENLPKLANAYPKAKLIPIHWGCVESTMVEFNGDPAILDTMVENPERVNVIALGEPFTLKKSNDEK